MAALFPNPVVSMIPAATLLLLTQERNASRWRLFHPWRNVKAVGSERPGLVNKPTQSVSPFPMVCAPLAPLRARVRSMGDSAII
jgi:hypothetical protein